MATSATLRAEEHLVKNYLFWGVLVDGSTWSEHQGLASSLKPETADTGTPVN
jgi:hypothetical protein